MLPSDKLLNNVAAGRDSRTGFNPFLISLSRVPALSATISGFPSGSWVMGDPHSGQNTRQTVFPESALPAQRFTLPLILSLSFGTTATRAAVAPCQYFLESGLVRDKELRYHALVLLTISRSRLTLASITVIVSDCRWSIDIDCVCNSLAKAVS